MATYKLPYGAQLVTDADGNAYLYTNGEVTGRYMVGRPDISTMSDPLAPGGSVYNLMQVRQNQGGGGGSATQPAASAGGAPPAPIPGQKDFGASLDAWLQWQVDNAMMSSKEARAAQKRAEKANREAQAKQDAYNAEQEKRYQEDKKRQARLEAEAKERNQYYNVQESIQQGLRNIQTALPAYMPGSVQSALADWASKLGLGFGASMPIKPDPQAFINYVLSKGYPGQLAPTASAATPASTPASSPTGAAPTFTTPGRRAWLEQANRGAK